MVATTATRVARAFLQLKRFNVTGAFKTLGMVGSPHLRELNKAARRMKHTREGRLDYASNAWLEMTYGWKPLLMDLDNIASDLASRWARDPSDLLIRGTGSSDPYFKYSNTSSASVNHTVSGKTRVGIIAHARVIDADKRNRAGLGLHPIGAANLVWELLPFSFVADWIVPVQPFLESLSATEGLTFVSGSRSDVKRHQLNLKVTDHTSYLDTNFPLYWDEKYQYFKRTVLTNFPPSSAILRFKSPFSGGANRALTSLALLKKVFFSPYS
jgi:hypothetical protein